MNPYDPQRPTRPDTFAGREDLVKKTKEFLERAVERRIGAAILVHGHRGSGKTSALRKIQAMASEAHKDAIVVEVPLRQRVEEGVLLRDIIEEVKREVRAKAGARSLFARMSQRISRIDVSILGAGVGISTDRHAGAHNPMTVWRECLAAIADAPLVCVCIDDAELIEPAGLGTLKTLAETEGEVPVLLAAAGGPDFLARLSQEGSSPVARVFSGATFDMEAFKLPETREALLARIRAAGASGKWTAQAIERVQMLSHGSPYLVQCIAHAAYGGGSPISADDVRNSIENAVRTAEPWLRSEIPQASDSDIVSFVKLAETGRSSFRSVEVLGLGIQTPYIGRLVKLGVLKKVARGHYELRKAPVIAYYHSLKRQLKGSSST